MESIYVTGVPGTGKSTLAKLIGDYYNLEVLEIKDLVINKELEEEYDVQRETLLFDENIVTQALEQQLEQRNYVIAGPILPINPEYVYKIIVLSASPVTLQTRLEARNYPQHKIQENIEAELVGVVLGQAMDYFTQDKIIAIDTSKHTITNTFEIIKQALSTNLH